MFNVEHERIVRGKMAFHITFAKWNVVDLVGESAEMRKVW